MRRAALIAAAVVFPTAPWALAVTPPGAEAPVAERQIVAGSYAVPVGPFADGEVPMLRAEGKVTTRVWHVPGEGMTTLQILAPLRAALIEAGYAVIYDCAAAECGGFDFRYSVELLPEPVMHVDLGDFRFLSARNTASGEPDYVSLMVSRSSTRGFVQMTRIGAAEPAPADSRGSTKRPLPTLPAESGALSDQLDQAGRTVLKDVRFATGSSQLDGEDFASLEALAAYLRDHPDRSVVLVGHTDAEGGLASNVALSRERARAVMDHLIGRLGVPAGQLAAEGVGFLAPLASNLTETGRTLNRRVEAIVSSTR
ncbi:outer membrane protein OmpA-like peptidoglycan-associated protein [Rhodovulum iodosum]|uniref:Outer membrane protein OmpA-like peptidoglycan-associated protein n=1 Tax=Rhodovulum iodosum TaxID=68291 RepID=A0ABV3XRT8_9RHOB|nr:OmpA family protein [Rhodovulum robiginosum]RSK39416.1 OmpA family protein [Rhodovulum robiginosum]